MQRYLSFEEFFDAEVRFASDSPVEGARFRPSVRSKGTASPGFSRPAAPRCQRQQGVGPVDWLFSDVVCYPARLLALVERWLATGTCRNFVCTVKFQGPTDHETARRFAAIPGSLLRHLFHNKHELTWIKID
jgi:hypothetical protein